MLKQRVITALVLLALLLPTLWAREPLYFTVFIAVTLTLAGWEWARLNSWTHGQAAVHGLLTLAVFGSVLYAQAAQAQLFWLVVLMAWVLGGAWALRAASGGWSALPVLPRQFLGVLVLVPAGLAFMAWKQQGLNALLSVLCLVWVADVAAYFGGRRFGKRKLAPAISPGKSWEGVWSGWLGVLLLALLWITQIDPRWPQAGQSVYGQLVDGFGWPLAALMLILLAALSVVGDLVESLIKRAAGAKDSSRLLPGHGGVLDRIDALLPALPAALALCLLAKGLPA